jgi:rhomboid family GlyGly-CTERM serine protease
VIDPEDRGPVAWIGVAMVLLLCAFVGWSVPRLSIDWQPGLAASEAWRAFSAVGVHYSFRHLLGNAAGAAVVGVFGTAARVPLALAFAWLAAWPLTHIALLIRPELQHYGGLSGVLHAGVTIIAVWLLVSATTRAQRWLGVAVAIGLTAKVLSESPWGPVLRQSANWDIAVAPLAHATGVIAGLLCAVAALWWAKKDQPRMRPTSAEVE